MLIKYFYILFMIYITLLIILTYNCRSIDYHTVNYHYSIGYFSNCITGLFTKLIGIAAVAGLCILKHKQFISNIYSTFYSI